VTSFRAARQCPLLLQVEAEVGPTWARSTAAGMLRHPDSSARYHPASSWSTPARAARPRKGGGCLGVTNSPFCSTALTSTGWVRSANKLFHSPLPACSKQCVAVDKSLRHREIV